MKSLKQLTKEISENTDSLKEEKLSSKDQAKFLKMIKNRDYYVPSIEEFEDYAWDEFGEDTGAILTQVWDDVVGDELDKMIKNVEKEIKKRIKDLDLDE